MNRVFRILNIRHIGRRNTTRIRKDSESVISDTRESHGGEYDGVHNSRRGDETEPPVNEDKDCREIDKGDCQDDDGNRRRKCKASLHFIGKQRREANRRRGDGGSGEEGELFRWELGFVSEGNEEEGLNVGRGAATVACVLRIWALVDCSFNKRVPLLGGYLIVN